MRFQEGDRAYIVVNNLYTRPCHVVRTDGDMCVVSFGNDGAFRVWKSRLFRTAEETGKPMAGVVKSADEVVGGPEQKERTPWDWV